MRNNIALSRTRRSYTWIPFIIGCFSFSCIFGQIANEPNAFKPAFKNLVFEEDYSALVDSSLRDNVWTKLKYIPLYSNGYLTFGGEIRPRVEIREHLSYGRPLEDEGANFHQRSRLWLDWHVLKGARLFTEIQAGSIYGLTAPPSPVDQNQVEIHQAFFEYAIAGSARQRMFARIGRQEIAFGRFRLFDVRMPPNRRIAFDAARLGLEKKGWRFDAILGLAVRDNFGSFNDNSNTDLKLLAGRAERKFSSILPHSSIEFLYLYTDRRSAPSPTFIGRRNTLSLRLSGLEKRWNYDIELIGQAGTDGMNRRISAWYVGSETNFNPDAAWKPYLGWRIDIASGDKDPNDNQNNAYDFLWSRGITWAPDLGYTNLIILGPTLGAKSIGKLSIDTWIHGLWRTSAADGLYRISGGVQRTADEGSSSYVGLRGIVRLEYPIGRHLLLGYYMVKSFNGAFLTENPDNRNLFNALTYVTFRF